MQSPSRSSSSEDPDVQVRHAKRPCEDRSDEPFPFRRKPLELNPEYRHVTFKERCTLAPKAEKPESFDLAKVTAMWKEAEPVYKRVLASIPDETSLPLFVVHSFGPDTLPEAGAASKRSPDTPIWNVVKSICDDNERRRAENPEAYGKEAFEKFIERKKSESEMCKICLKSNVHATVCCPYLESYPEGEPVGPDVELVCQGCGASDAHPGIKTGRRAIRMMCSICAKAGHWCTDCPNAQQLSNVGEGSSV